MWTQLADTLKRHRQSAGWFDIEYRARNLIYMHHSTGVIQHDQPVFDALNDCAALGTFAAQLIDSRAITGLESRDHRVEFARELIQLQRRRRSHGAKRLFIAYLAQSPQQLAERTGNQRARQRVT